MAAIQKYIAQQVPSWELYRSFLAVMRTGSLSAAARQLEATQPTIGRHIEALEAFLGATLFVRSPGGLAPNPVAQELLPHAERMEMAAASLLRAASGRTDEVAGTVRIAASHVVGGEILPGMLATFHSMQPRIDIELALSNDPSDLLRGEADIAVRMFRPTQEALIAKRIGQVRIGLFAHRHYAERRGLPERLADLEKHTLIGFDRDALWARAQAGLKIQVDRSLFALRCDSELAQLAALRAGFGIGACQAGIARRDPNLLPVLPNDIAFPLEIWLTMHRDQKAVRRIALLFDHLAQALGEWLGAGSPPPQPDSDPAAGP